MRAWCLILFNKIDINELDVLQAEHFSSAASPLWVFFFCSGTKNMPGNCTHKLATRASSVRCMCLNLRKHGKPNSLIFRRAFTPICDPAIPTPMNSHGKRVIFCQPGTPTILQNALVLACHKCAVLAQCCRSLKSDVTFLRTAKTVLCRLRKKTTHSKSRIATIRMLLKEVLQVTWPWSLCHKSFCGKYFAQAIAQQLPLIPGRDHLGLWIFYRRVQFALL